MAIAEAHVRRFSIQVIISCVVLVGAVFVLSLINRKEGEGTPERNAYDAAIGFLSHQLEDSSVAVFCPFSEADIENTRENQWVVALWYEAPGKNDVMMRQDYEITVAYNENRDSWS